MAKDYTIGVVGNPNCGKTTLFNALTGARQHVGNWPGVTVERKTGDFQYKNFRFELVDLPGTYSLDVTDESVSLDEQIARDYVAKREADLIVNIVDASNIERNLYLTAQLIEMRVPVLVALNMMDVARERDIRIDIRSLSEKLDCPVVPIVAAKKKGLDSLREMILVLASKQHSPRIAISYAPAFEEAVNQVSALPGREGIPDRCDTRWLAIKLLEADSLARRLVDEEVYRQVCAIREKAEESLEDDLDIAAADGRYTFVNELVQTSVSKATQVKRSTSDRIDRIVLNRALGIPIFLLVMYSMFMLTINLGSAFIDFFDLLAGTFLVDGFGHLLSEYGAPGWLVLLLATGVGGGIQVVATFIPVIGFLYLFLSVLEDSGYMARAAFVMDRFMRFIGLPGKAFVPLLVGFGCNVPAIMATRTMENARDRVLTILMNPFMSCGARLPVYALFAAAFFPVGGQNLVFGLYLIGIGVAVMTGLIMTNTVFRGESAPFVMELPTYHLPTLSGVLLRTWDRLKTFLFRAGKVIVPMVMVLNTLNAIGTDGSFGNENSENSLLSEIGRTIAPAFAPMGLNEENWPATVGIFTGVLAKEAVVGTLDALYGQLNQPEQGQSGKTDPNEGFDWMGGIRKAFATVPENLTALREQVLDPLGLNIGDISDDSSAAAEQDVVAGTYAAMRSRFDGQAGAFAYLLFILLYFPCVAATAAVYRETNAGWTVFVACWTTGLAYMAATIFYQIAVFAEHPVYSFSWIAGLVSFFLFVVLILRLIGRHRNLSDRNLVAEV
ncbi:MAG: Fe(2+) transporter permease subunit FeoB [Methylococcaceae bacterium]|nr:Fe(2+) transporter permease subunit FeoB [Methylococcaceae bacterium]